MELYRPLNANEFHEVEARSFRGFPPRPAEQPLFTALLSEEGASQIARHMRIAKECDNIVYVVKFLVEDAYIRQFPVQHVQERKYTCSHGPSGPPHHIVEGAAADRNPQASCEEP